jgi:hypothetical protein
MRMIESPRVNKRVRSCLCPHLHDRSTAMMAMNMMQRIWRCVRSADSATPPLILLLLLSWTFVSSVVSIVVEASNNDAPANDGSPPSTTIVEKTPADATLLLQQQTAMGTAAATSSIFSLTQEVNEMNDAPNDEVGAAALLLLPQQQLNADHKNIDNNNNNNLRDNRRELVDLVYSNMATIVPDPEHLPIDPATHDAYAAKWDAWHFWDGQEEDRPTGDYAGEFDPIHRDIPANDLPDESWQVDAVFVNHLLNDGEKLVSRAMEAIFTEYGHGKPLPPEGLGERLRMFHWEKLVDLSQQTSPPAGFERRSGKRSTGGWTTKRSWNGLVRRLLHACMTNDEFVVVLGGHSAAAGHGNHFRQSYMMQFHRIVSPVLARLGVKLVTRNMSQGGLGTLQASLGMQDIYGGGGNHNGIDLLLWDSGMTETSASHKDFFLRQALLGGKTKIPVVWGGASMDFAVLKYLNQHADIDVGQYGLGLDGIIPVTSAVQAESGAVPYASRYMQCNADVQFLCDEAPRFCATCWIDRDDIPKSQAQEMFPNLQSTPGSQVKWHPGWREHQLQGRVLAFAVLDALQIALQIWSDGTMGGPPLDDEEWHVTDYYQNMRTKLQALGQREEQTPSSSSERGACWEMQKQGLPGRICTTALHGATQHTPRVNPTETSLTKLIRPASNGYKPQNLQQMQYDGPDVHNPCFDPEDGAIDVVAIVSGRRRRNRQRQLLVPSSSSWQDERDDEDYYYMPRLFRQLHESRQARVKAQEEQEKQRSLAAISAASSSSTHNRKLRSSTRLLAALDDERIEPGIGWQVEGELPGICDGSYYAICGREKTSSCPLLGHHDGRGQVVGNEYSGWLVFDLPALEKGLIILKLFTWNPQEANRVTDGWTSVNNQDGSQTRRGRQLSSGNEPIPFLDFLNENELSYMDHDPSYEWQPQPQEQQQDERRFLKGPALQPAGKTLPDDTFAFDFSIDGKITTWNKQQFMDHKKDVQRVLEAFVLLDDVNYISQGQPPRNVELAIRMRGCGRLCTFGVTHLYWA